MHILHERILIQTPGKVDYGQSKKVFEFRLQVLSNAFPKEAVDFKGKMPKPSELP